MVAIRKGIFQLIFAQLWLIFPFSILLYLCMLAVAMVVGCSLFLHSLLPFCVVISFPYLFIAFLFLYPPVCSFSIVVVVVVAFLRICKMLYCEW